MTSEKPKPRHGRTRRQRLSAAGPPTVLILGIVALVLLAALARPHVVTTAYRATGGGPQAMAVTGWAVTLVPFWLVCLVMVIERLAIRIPLAVATAPLLVLAVSAFPTRGGQPIEPTGPGTADFLTGAHCGQFAILLTVGMGMIFGLGGGARFRRGRATVSLDQTRMRVRAAATGAAIAAVSLLVAVYAAS